MIRAQAQLDVLDCKGITPLADAIRHNNRDCAELLLDAGAKLANVNKDIDIPDWLNDIITKRQNVKRALLIFIGVLRRRFTVPTAATVHTGNRIPRDMVNVLAAHLWETRFNHKWILAGGSGGPVAKKSKPCKHKCKNKAACRHECCKN